VEVAEDPALREVARKLAEKSASLGRFYALVTVKQDDRARVLKAVEGVPGVKVSCEGEGRNRRVVFTPEKPAPLPKRSMLPDDDDEDDLEG
jgi:predicted RNA-binding protein Jag